MTKTTWIGAAVASFAAVSMALVAGPASGRSPQSVLRAQIAPYLAPQTLVHIGGGRTINLVCLGHGSPTVILSPPATGWSEAW